MQDERVRAGVGVEPPAPGARQVVLAAEEGAEDAAAAVHRHEAPLRAGLEQAVQEALVVEAGLAVGGVGGPVDAGI